MKVRVLVRRVILSARDSGSKFQDALRCGRSLFRHPDRSGGTPSLLPCLALRASNSFSLPRPDRERPRLVFEARVRVRIPVLLASHRS
jgi:hypothetical protein